jgi:hypothetical protein
MIRFDEHGVFQLTRPELLDAVNGAGPLPELPNAGCAATGADLACVQSNIGCPQQNTVCVLNGVCLPYDNIACREVNSNYAC